MLPYRIPTPQQESTCLTPRSVPERSAGQLLTSEVRKHAGRMPDMDLLLFFICTNLKKPIFHQFVQKFTEICDDFKSELNMGDRRISHALSDGRVPPPSAPLFGVGIHTANGGKQLCTPWGGFDPPHHALLPSWDLSRHHPQIHLEFGVWFPNETRRVRNPST
mgnify:CR=1 FL=1